VLVGLQASGKSTFYRQRFGDTHSLVSRDLFRNHRRPSERQRALLEAELRAGRPVVVDNTNPTVEDRAAILSVGRAFDVPAVCYFFVPDVRASLARNALREARERVPAVAIFATRKRLAPPALAEGFDRLFEVEAGEGDFRVREVMAGPDGAGARGR
jgi:predicted kinase